MNDETKQVVGRLKGSKIECPDCGKILDFLTIEKYEYRKFTVDYEKKVIFPMVKKHQQFKWEFDDWAARCPYCDSLNVDASVKDLKFETMI
jgi:DNA-directed RNA polymerase subunit RPC12/RpoP